MAQRSAARAAAAPVRTSATPAPSPTELGIAHYVFDYESRFRESVIQGFADEYMAGRTPIPACAATWASSSPTCSRSRATSAPIASPPAIMSAASLGRTGPELHRAVDPARDQSYFLFATTAEQLDYLRFPLGGMEKPAVRAIAAELGLGVAAQARQPGHLLRARRRLCQNRPQGSARGRRRRRDRPSRAAACSGSTRALSTSPSASAADSRSAACRIRSMSCVSIPATKRVIVGPKAALAVRAARLSEINWLGGDFSGPLSAKVRSMAKPVPARLEGDQLIFERSRIWRRARPGGGAL